MDVYLPERILGYGFTGAPLWNTPMTVVASGAENANQAWLHPMRKYTSPEGVRCWDDVAELHDMWMALRGPKMLFAFPDPADRASVRLAHPQESDADLLDRITAEDQVFGVGDGATRTFQLSKAYTYGPETYDRAIVLPVVASLLVADAGVPTVAFTAVREGGSITFDVAPANGHTLTWGGLYDVPVRFEGDDVFATVLQAFQTAGHADLTLIERKLC